VARTFKPPGRPPGDRLAPKLALLLKHVMGEHLKDSADLRSEIGVKAMLDFFKTLEVERDEHLADLLGMWLKHPDTHPAAEKALAFVHHGQGELGELLAHSIVGGSIGTAITSGMAAAFAGTNQQVMRTFQSAIPEPSTMAGLAAAGIVEEKFAAEIAASNGLPEAYTKMLIKASQQWPGVAQLIELIRRNQISLDEAKLALERSAVPTEMIEPLLSLRVEHLSPEELASLVLKGFRTLEEILPEAESSGYSKERMEALITMSGEPPGLEQLQEFYRRGFITQAGFEHGVRESRVKDEWIDILLKARFAPASPADAINGAVQGHLTLPQAKEITELGGLRPEDFQWMYETSGNPPGNIQMIELWRRGHLTQAEVEQGIREGHTKDKYVPHIINLKRALPSIIQIKTMLEKGALPTPEAEKLLEESGYEKDVVGPLIAAFAAPKVHTAKELSATVVEELFYEVAIDETQAIKDLEGLGYSAANAKAMLHAQELKREKTLRQAAQAAVKAALVSRKITENEAQTQLLALGLPHGQVTFILTMWKVDREAHVVTLTAAQITKANIAGLIADGVAEERLELAGYSHEDARILLDLEHGRTTPAP
jgi:hypothetical protein